MSTAHWQGGRLPILAAWLFCPLLSAAIDNPLGLGDAGLTGPVRVR
jgi:hypothetical protein